MNNLIKRQFSTKTTKKLTTKKLDKKLSDFGVFDIETFVYEGKHIPYSYLDNENSFLSNDNSLSIETRKNMLIEQFFDKIIEVGTGKYVFAHNFSKFDGFYRLSYFMKKTNEKKNRP